MSLQTLGSERLSTFVAPSVCLELFEVRADVVVLVAALVWLLALLAGVAGVSTVGAGATAHGYMHDLLGLLVRLILDCNGL